MRATNHLIHAILEDRQIAIEKTDKQTDRYTDRKNRKESRNQRNKDETKKERKKERRNSLMAKRNIGLRILPPSQHESISATQSHITTFNSSHNTADTAVQIDIVMYSKLE